MTEQQHSEEEQQDSHQEPWVKSPEPTEEGVQPGPGEDQAVVDTRAGEEDELAEYVPAPTDMTGTLDTTGVGAGANANLKNIAPAFEEADERVAEQLDDAGVESEQDDAEQKMEEAREYDTEERPSTGFEPNQTGEDDEQVVVGEEPEQPDQPEPEEPEESEESEESETETPEPDPGQPEFPDPEPELPDQPEPEGEPAEPEEVVVEPEPEPDEESLPDEEPAEDELDEPVPEEEAGQFDPAAYTVPKVNEYLETADEEERQRVLDAERAGKARSGILNR